MRRVFEDTLIRHGMGAEDARASARIITQSSLDGVYSHGVNRFPRIVSHIDRGIIDVGARAEKSASFGSLERWDGRLAMGCLNAMRCMERACALAREMGAGVVALGRTNHWMRGGTYGWQAADAGYIGVCWTNTMPNMPPWGAKENGIGNNPFIMAIPRPDGAHVVIDCAMSQFAYGKVEMAGMKGERLPIPGGWDRDGNVTDDPRAILESGLLLPTGYWKGSGLSIALDLAAAVLSGGKTVRQIGADCEDEYDLSQVFIALDPSRLDSWEAVKSKVDDTLQSIHSAPSSGNGVFYPGEIEYKTRRENSERGIPVLEQVWETILSL